MAKFSEELRERIALEKTNATAGDGLIDCLEIIRKTFQKMEARE